MQRSLGWGLLKRAGQSTPRPPPTRLGTPASLGGLGDCRAWPPSGPSTAWLVEWVGVPACALARLLTFIICRKRCGILKIKKET